MIVNCSFDLNSVYMNFTDSSVTTVLAALYILSLVFFVLSAIMKRITDLTIWTNRDNEWFDRITKSKAYGLIAMTANLLLRIKLPKGRR